jgi:hypothetical protein
MANYEPPGDDENAITYALPDQADTVGWISENLG